MLISVCSQATERQWNAAPTQNRKPTSLASQEASVIFLSRLEISWWQEKLNTLQSFNHLFFTPNFWQIYAYGVLIVLFKVK